MTDFAKQVEKFADKCRKRYRAAARESVQETISLAQRTEREGGRMRVDTGFLRASVQAAQGAMPVGPTSNPDNVDFKNVSQAAGEPVPAALVRWDPMKARKLFVGWTAAYARPREYKDGFLRGATEQWDITVRKAAARAEAEIG